MFGRKAVTDYAKLSYDQLLTLRSDIDAEIRIRGTAELDDLKRRLEVIADAQGVAVTELFGSKKERKERKTRQPKIRFRNPDNPEETWSGRGRPKKWLQEKLDQGATQEQFLVGTTT